MWRRFAAAALAGLAVLVAAAAALADPLDPKTRVVPRDEAAAAAVLPTRSDLGAAWSGGRITPVSLKMPRCPQLEPDFSHLTLTGHVEARYANGNGGWQIDTDVTVMRAARQVRAQFARLFVPQIGTCIRYDVSKSTGASPSIKLGRVQQLKLPRYAPFERLYRTAISVKTGGGTVTVYDDTLMLGKGRFSVWMNLVAPSTDASTIRLRERQLAKLVVSRIPSK